MNDIAGNTVAQIYIVHIYAISGFGYIDLSEVVNQFQFDLIPICLIFTFEKKMNSFECHLFQFLKFSKKSQFDCSSTKLTVSNTNVMPKLSTMNGHSETPAPSSVTPDYLQPTTNSSVNLSSNSSLNSSSVKSIASKSNDGTATDKKRKSLSSSRQKKFHRRFKQVAMDEEVINCMYFECIFSDFNLLKSLIKIVNIYS